MCVWMLTAKRPGYEELVAASALHRLQALGALWKQKIIYVVCSHTDFAKSSTLYTLPVQVHLFHAL